MDAGQQFCSNTSCIPDVCPADNFIGLTGKTTTANIVGQVPLSIMPALMINLAVRNIASVDDWLFIVILLGIAVVASSFIWVFSSKLSTETIILSI